MDLPPPPPVVAREGRGVPWRAGMAFLGAALLGGAAALVLWPWLFAWAAAGALAAAGLFFLASALLAKGRRSA